MAVNDPLLDKLRAEIGRDLRPVRPLRPAWLRALLLLPWAVAGLAALSVIFSPRWGVSGLTWLVSGVQIFVAYVLLWIALREAEPGGSPSGLALAAAGIAALAVPLAVWLLLLNVHPRPLPEAREWRVGLECISVEMALGLPVAAFGLWLAHRGLPLRPAAAGALAGLAAGAGAVGVWTLFCPFTSPQHVLAAHGGPLVVLGLVGVALAASLVYFRRHSRR
jgi:hypothetical protein